MSEVTNDDQVITTPAQGSGEEGKLNSVDQMPGDNQLAYETYKKALAQRHKFKEEAETLRLENESLKQKELEAEGKLKEKADYWKTKAVELEDKYKKSTAKYGWSQVKSQLSTELMKQGCVDTDVAISLIDKAELNSVEVNDEYNVNATDLTRIVDSLKRDNRTQKIRLFGTPVGVNDMVPDSSQKFEEKKPNTGEMTSDELIAELKKS